MNDMEKMLLQRINEDDYVKPVSRDELVAELDDEIDKSEPDIDFIRETMQSILECDGAEIDESDTDKLVKELVAEAKRHNIVTKRKRNIRFGRLVAVASAASIVLIGAGVASDNLGGHRLSTAVVKYFKGGVGIYVDENIINLQTSEGDPYGIKSKCQEYGMEVMVPEYIPDGFVLTNIKDYIMYDSKNIKFNYQNNDMKINISYKKSLNDSEFFIMPTDTYNVSEEKINGKTIYVLREDNQFTAEYYNW